MTTIQPMLQYIFLVEGGLVDNPNDPGGRTNLGVTQAVYHDWRRSRGEPLRDVALITTQEAVGIYEQLYWEPNHCDQLPWPVNICHFDACVNMGGAAQNKIEAARLLQKTLGVPADGVIGPVTMSAIHRVAVGNNVWVWRYVWERWMYYSRLIKKNSRFAEFQYTWTWRLDQLLQRIAEGLHSE